MRLLEFLLILILIAALGAIWLVSGEKLAAADARISALTKEIDARGAADVQHVQAAEAACSDRVADALSRGATIARLTAPRARSAPAVQAMFSAAEIRSATGIPRAP